MVHLEQRQLLLQTVFALAECVDPTPYRRDTLPEVQVEPLDKGGIDLPGTGSQDLFDSLKCAKHHAVAHAPQTPTPHGLDHLRLERFAIAYLVHLGHNTQYETLLSRPP